MSAESMDRLMMFIEFVLLIGLFALAIATDHIKEGVDNWLTRLFRKHHVLTWVTIAIIIFVALAPSFIAIIYGASHG